MISCRPQFSVFLGVDQTGAKGPRPDTARPLPTCLVQCTDRNRWRLMPTLLESLSRDSVRRLLLEIGAEQENLALVVDSVIGLPDTHWPVRASADALWEIMRQAHNFHGFGRDTASAYFRTIDRLEAPGGLRRCEELTGAQSVFLAQPFQRNVQTGTFRVWKDLTASGKDRWCRIWPFEQPDSEQTGQRWLFEVYPSLLWRQEFGFGTRAPEQIDTVITKTSEKTGCNVTIEKADRLQLAADPDLADAAVSALGALLLQQTDRLWEPDASFRHVSEVRREGWLIGLTTEGVVR